MVHKNKDDPCCKSPKRQSDEIKVESIATIDDRGQMVLPKAIRDKAGINAGDRLAIVTRETNGRVCCLYMFKTEDLVDKVKSMIGPLEDEMK